MPRGFMSASALKGDLNAVWISANGEINRLASPTGLCRPPIPRRGAVFKQREKTPRYVLRTSSIQSLDGHLCKARIGTSTQLFCWPVQIWPLRNNNTVPFGLKEIAKAGPAIGGDPCAMDP